MATVSAAKFFGGKAPPPPAQTVIHTPDTPPSFLERLRTDFGNRTAQVQASKDRQAQGKQGVLSTILQDAGQVAGAGGDVIKEAVSPTINKAADVISNIPAVQRSATGGAGAKVLDAADGITSRYQAWAEQHPVAAKNLEASVNIANLLPAERLAGAGAEIAGRTASEGATAAADAAHAGYESIGQGVQRTGQKIQQTVIRPSARDITDGFKIENVSKYDLGGSLPETITKAHTTMNELTHELAHKLEGSDASVNLNKTFADTASRLVAGKARAFGDNTAINRVLKSLQAEIKNVAGKDGDVSLVEATHVKRGAGSKGAWAFNRPEADASAIEKVYTEFYNVLKTQIEEAAPPGVREINKKLSEIIPIQNAALRRLPIEQRNNLFSLTDSIGLMSSLFDPKALLLLGATKAARSGRVGNVLTKAGEAMQKNRPSKP
jgi:hypothetical protein